MGWFDKHKPEGAKDGDQSKSEMDTLLEKFGTMLDERTKPTREAVEAMQAKWNAIEAEATKVTPPDTRPRDENGNVRDLTPEEKQRGLNIALAEQNVQNAARFIERDVLDALPADWKDLKPEIQSMFNNTPVARKAAPDYMAYCNNCCDVVIAREARKGGVRRNSETKEFFLEDKSTSSITEDSILSDPALAWRSPDGLRSLSAADQLRKLGIDPKEFEESAKKGLV
jgi:hypothetical protein